MKAFFLTSILGLFHLNFCIAQQISFEKLETYQRHSELQWRYDGQEDIALFQINKLDKDQNLTKRNISSNYLLDFTPADILDSSQYYILGLDGLGKVIATSDTIDAFEFQMTDEQMLDMVQKYTFRYFYDFAHPVSGLARERNSSGDIVTTGGSGFGIMALLVGIENGYISREEGVTQMIKIVTFLQFADKFHGVFPHWMNGKTGKTIPFSQYDNGGDLVETSFLMEGLLTAKQYFNLDNALEKAIRDIITNLYEDVEWDFYSKNNSGVLYWHWSPNYAWQMNFPLVGYNEALITYLLAIASPTHPISATYWKSGWTKSNYANGNSWFGHKLFVGPAYGGPLFFSHYSFMGFDPRNIKDQYANYFENCRNHTLINRAYCIYNPLNHKKYNEKSWGLTASDNPFGYSAHQPGNDNGTIAPTAALSSMPYTPIESMDALRHFYLEEGESLFGPLGFYDAFNGDQSWYADSYLAIDQGPIVCMIQNYRNQMLWNNFMKNAEIQPALESIGFLPDVSLVEGQMIEVPYKIFPNPTSSFIYIQTTLPFGFSVSLYNLNGSLMLKSGTDQNELSIDIRGIQDGLYLLKLSSHKTATSDCKLIYIEH